MKGGVPITPVVHRGLADKTGRRSTIFPIATTMEDWRRLLPRFNHPPMIERSHQDRAAWGDHTCDVMFQGGASYETEFNGTPPFTPTRLDGLRAIGSWPGAGSSQVVLTILQLDSLVTVVVVGYFMVRSFT